MNCIEEAWCMADPLIESCRGTKIVSVPEERTSHPSISLNAERLFDMTFCTEMLALSVGTLRSSK